MKFPDQFPKSRHFTLETLADGIYAAIHKEGGWAIANAGIVDLGDITLVFDSFMTPAAAEDLRLAAEALTGRSVAIVVNSHFHNDHIWGNQVFLPGAKIVSTTAVRQQIQTDGQIEYEWFFENSSKEFARLKKELATEKDPDEVRKLNFWAPYYEGLAKTMPTLDVSLPSVTFRERMLINGNKRQAEIRTYGGGHSGDDAFLIIAEEGIGFLGDLLFVNNHPFLADGDPKALVTILERIAALGLEIMVPGHGPTGGPADLDANILYAKSLIDLASQLPEGDAAEGVLKSLEAPEQFSTWRLPNFFKINMRFLHKRASSSMQEN
jgi:cyclase